MSDDPVRVAFVCVQNAGRSQMAHAFAERERAARGLDDVAFLSGGTDPADRVHPEVVEAMAEVGIDLYGRVPRELTHEDVERCDVVVTMGCSAEGVCPATWRGDARDWDLEDPHGREPEAVRALRDEVAALVDALLEELSPPYGPAREPAVDG